MSFFIPLMHMRDGPREDGGGLRLFLGGGARRESRENRPVSSTHPSSSGRHAVLCSEGSIRSLPFFQALVQQLSLRAVTSASNSKQLSPPEATPSSTKTDRNSLTLLLPRMYVGKLEACPAIECFCTAEGFVGGFDYQAGGPTGCFLSNAVTLVVRAQTTPTTSY